MNRVDSASSSSQPALPPTGEAIESCLAVIGKIYKCVSIMKAYQEKLKDPKLDQVTREKFRTTSALAVQRYKQFSKEKAAFSQDVINKAERELGIGLCRLQVDAAKQQVTSLRDICQARLDDSKKSP